MYFAGWPHKTERRWYSSMLGHVAECDQFVKVNIRFILNMENFLY